MNSLDRVSRNCLGGQAPPDDLRRLWAANDQQPWGNSVAFTLTDNLDPEFFAGYREQDGVSPNVANAYRRMFAHIAFIGKRKNGELVGYWLGPENRAASQSPIVELDTEGQFHLRGRNLAEYLLACVFSEGDFSRLRRSLADLGLPVAAKNQSELFGSFDSLRGEFGSPNEISRRYQKGLDAPPPTKLRFGNYKFPDAAKALRDLGIDKITPKSTRENVIELLGTPTETGGGAKDPIFGYMNPWIKYNRPDCQLRFEFEKNKGIKVVSLIEPGWEPGM